MKRITKYFLGLALALGTMVAMPHTAEAAYDVDTSKAVIDKANVLSAETEEYITDISIALTNECGAQIGVYTIDNIGNDTMENCAYEIFNSWGLGDADKDNGVLILMSIGDDDYYFTRGTGIESQLTNQMLGKVIDDYMEPNWVKGDYDKGAKLSAEAIADYICDIYNVDIDYNNLNSYGDSYDNSYSDEPPAVNEQSQPEPMREPTKESGGLFSGFFSGLFNVIKVILIIIAFIVILIILSVISSLLGGGRRGRGPRPPRPPRHYGGPRPPRHYGGPRPPRRYDAPRPPRPSAPPRPPMGGGPSRPSAPSRPSRPSGGVSRPSRPSGGVSRPSRPSGGGFKAGGGSSRGGGMGRRH